MWALHDRIECHVTEDTCKAEIESFERHGQLLPVLGRPVHDDPDYDVEIICGARRLFVARYLNRPLQVELRGMSDQEAIVAMDIENRQRLDISPYERGRSYARWIQSGYFSSQEDVARALNISTSQVSRLLKLARLPAAIVNAFASPTDIRECWAHELTEALENAERRRSVLEKARAIATQVPRPAAADVYRQLLAASAAGRKVPRRALDEVVKGADQTPYFRIRHRRNTVALLLPVTRVSAEVLESVRVALLEILQRAAPPASVKRMRPVPRRGRRPVSPAGMRHDTNAGIADIGHL